MATITQITNIVFNKWTLIVGGILIIYLSGGFNIITDNPILMVFAGLILLIVILSLSHCMHSCPNSCRDQTVFLEGVVDE